MRKDGSHCAEHDTAGEAESQAAESEQKEGRRTIKELAEVIAKALVENPAEVVVTEKEDGRNVIVELHVASSKVNKRVAVEII